MGAPNGANTVPKSTLNDPDRTWDNLTLQTLFVFASMRKSKAR